MKEITSDMTNFMLRTLQNYYYLKRESTKMKKRSNELNERLEDEMKAKGISYDGESGTYNNTDTPYICQLIHEKASCELEATHYEWAAKDLDKFNKISKRFSTLTFEQKLTINAICNKNISIQEYAEIEGVSRQAIKDRLNNALRKMMEVE